jgi:hypothetical protein
MFAAYLPLPFPKGCRNILAMGESADIVDISGDYKNVFMKHTARL